MSGGGGVCIIFCCATVHLPSLDHHVSVCVCVCVCVCACVHMCMCVYVHAHACVCVHACVRVSVHVFSACNAVYFSVYVVDVVNKI